MTKGERQLLRESAFKLLGSDEIEGKLAGLHGLDLRNRHDRKQVQEAITRVKNAMERLSNA